MSRIFIISGERMAQMRPQSADLYRGCAGGGLVKRLKMHAGTHSHLLPGIRGMLLFVRACIKIDFITNIMKMSQDLTYIFLHDFRIADQDQGSMHSPKGRDLRAMCAIVEQVLREGDADHIRIVMQITIPI